jgi:hypothetical protein
MLKHTQRKGINHVPDKPVCPTVLHQLRAMTERLFFLAENSTNDSGSAADQAGLLP